MLEADRSRAGKHWALYRATSQEQQTPATKRKINTKGFYFEVLEVMLLFYV